MLDRFRKGSILHYLTLVGVIFSVILIIGFQVIFANIMRQSRDNAILAEYLVNLNSIHSEIYDLKASSILLSRNENEEEVLEDHIAKSRVLQDTIDSFLYDYELSEESRNTLRRLTNLNSYQQKLLEKEQTDQEFYFNARYIAEALDEHIAEFYSMVKFELDKALTTYADTERTVFVHSGVMIACLFIFIAVTFVIFIRFSLSIRKSINTSLSNLKSIAKHEWTVSDLPEDEDFSEFQQLSHEINHEKKELRKYFDEIERSKELEVKLLEQARDAEITKKLLVTTEMDMLKSQINPHFIFNSLHQIGMATLLKEPEDVLQMVEYTGNILRYSLYNKDAFVELGEELHIVRQYIGLQQICSPGSVTLNIEDETVDDSLPEKILPMCIQPIVENSMKHAGSEDRCLAIDILVRRCGGMLVISITDNGPGTSDVAHILERSKKSIGLKNIARRMTLTYGRNDLMNIESEEGRFFRITLAFPEKDE